MIIPDYVWHTMGGAFLGIMTVLGFAWFKSLSARVHSLETHVANLEKQTQEQEETICEQRKKIRRLRLRLEANGLTEDSEPVEI